MLTLPRWQWLWTACLALVLLLQAGAASAVYVQRYQSIANGAVVFTGNTLGLDRNGSNYTPGTSGSLGAFINSDTSASFSTFAPGSIGSTSASNTLWQNNKSEASLSLPSGGRILYAELIWGGNVNAGGSDVTSSLNAAVTFTTPAGSFSVQPDSNTSQTVNTGSNGNYYVRSANVTGLVQLGGMGRYAVRGVPSSYGNSGSAHGAGWTLAVVYESVLLPTRNLSIFVGSEPQGASPAAVSGFCTPNSGLLKARALVTATEGDASLGGDKFLFGPTSALTDSNRLSGPNNPLNNFFAGQINNSNGALDTSGSIGTRNHTAITDTGATLQSGARTGWDITNVDASGNLVYGQTSAFSQGTTNQDQYVITGLALQIDLSAPRFNTSNSLSVNKTSTYVGDELTYTLRLQNVGGAGADNVVVRSQIPAGMSFVSGSVTIDGAANASASLANGISVGTVAANATRLVTYRLRVDTLPAVPDAAEFEHQARWTYDYLPCANRSRELSEAGSNATVTPAVRLEGRKVVDPQGTVPNGSVLTYTVTINNTGSIASSGTTLLDALASGTTYVPNSTRMNGVVIADGSGGIFPFASAALIKSGSSADGVIAVGASSVVQFQAQVVSPSALIINRATYDPDGTGPAPSRSVTAVNSAFAPPRASKVFSPDSVSEKQKTRLSITLSNDNPQAITSVAFSDVMPSELSVAAVPAISNSCGGTVTAPAGGIEIRLANGVIPANGSCVLAIDVQTSVSGSFTNTIPAGAVSSAEANPSNVAAQATLTVRQAPLVSKAFSPATILRQQTSRLTITIVNPESTALSALSVTDNLPSGLVVASTPSGSTTCGGTLTATAGASSITLSGGNIAANGVCTLSANVTSSTPGVYRNVIPAGGVIATGSANAEEAQADLNVAALQVSKSFGTNPVAVNTNSLLTITLINAAPTAITGVSFTDSFPSGLVTNGTATETCTGGTVSSSSTSVTLSNATIPAAGSCTVTINTRSATPGDYVNTIAIGEVTSTNAGSNTQPASATLSVSQPSVIKAFSPSTVQTGQTSTLTITLRNPNTASNTNITGVSLTDVLPAGLSASGAGGTCTGTKTVGVQADGRHFVRITGGTIPFNASGTGSCTLTATVTGSTGVYTNVIPVGAVTTSNSGTNGSEAQANLVVIAKPVVTKSFDVASISPGTTARLTVTVENPNAVDITALSVTDVFPTSPGAMTVAAEPDESNACGGSLVDSGGAALAAGDAGIRLTGAVVPAFSTCSFAVNVTASAVGTYNNQIPVANVSGTVESLVLNSAQDASASLVVRVLPPVIEKSFTASITTTQQAELVLKITNPNPNTALTGVGVRDVFPTVPGNMTIASPLTRSLTGCGGTSTGSSGTVGLLQNQNGAALAVGSSGLRLSNATVAAGGVCEIKVKVRVSAAGGYLNTTEAVTSANGGTGTSASAALTVYAPPTLSKQFLPDEVGVNASSRLSLSLFNGNANFAITGAAFSDIFPDGLLLATNPDPVMTCSSGSSLSFSARAGGAGYDFSAGNLAANGVCTFAVNVRAGAIGEYVNTTTTVTTTNAGTAAAASATLRVNGYTLSGTVYDDRNANSVLDAADQPLTPALYVKLATRAGSVCQSPATHVVQTDAAGAYSVVGVRDGDYCLLIDTSSSNSDLTVTLPAGYASTEAPGGLRTLTVAASNVGQLNFGLFRGARIDGIVFEDNGSASGIAHDGLRNGGEIGLNGVRVSARHASCSNGLCAEALTDSEGRFQFLLPTTGTLSSFKIAESNPAGRVSVSGLAGNTGGSYARTPDDITFTLVPGNTYGSLSFGDVLQPTWLADAQLNIRPDGVVFYSHVFTAKTAGTVSFSSVSTPAPAFAGWSQLLYLDSNCNQVLDAGETAYASGTTVPVVAEQKVCVLLRQTVASNASMGIRNSTVLTATFRYTNVTPALTTALDNTDITTVSLLSSGLILIKQVDKATALPGEALNYTITYRNGSNQPLDTIEIKDVTPAYTTFVSGGCNTPLPQSISACRLATFPSPGRAGDLMWTLTGQLQPGLEGSVRFRVMIDQ